MDLGIHGKTALVTGGDSGIGRQTARALLAEGAEVVVASRDADGVADAVRRLDAPGRVHGATVDVADPASVTRLHDEVAATVGDIDILVHSAGITGETGPFHESTEAGWAETLGVDLLGPVRVTRAFLPDLRRGGWGRIVFLASEDAVQPYADELPYCAAKAGILALAKGLSRSYAADGLLVNAVSPAFVHTPMTDRMMADRAESLGVSTDRAIASFLDEERPFLELGRRGEPEEVAAVIAFLCSDRASFVTGSDYRVDGGSVATI